ncbi:TPT-domain-containing protein [Parathielavia hyrcaniae]|uniref:TPT-domain-containing protein n=1 Tax=Parathielavia hyrcaniae TaxID=113614 RepID=A0AAN6T5F4_9PEZI|nr:TPT-domain-containing protein [Parathielavia hyrcaniae]
MADDDVERQVEKPRPAERSPHAVFYIANWIFFSNLTILFNKWIIDTGFRYPVILTCWHMIFATMATQVLARTTTLLDGRKSVKMTGRTYLRAIVPIGLLYSASLVCSNMVYLYLSVAFIQMLKAAAPVAVLLCSWAWRVEEPSLKRFLNILLIVAGVALASFGEIAFSMTGFLFQLGGIVFEAMRLVMIQVLLAGDTQKMDPLVSLYYYAPVCAVMNIAIAVATEASSFQAADLAAAGYALLLLNAMVAFMLNVSSVFLIGKTSGLVMTLTGILKNILLVIISVMIWHTAITGLQFLGYAIALAGLLYYSLGRDQLLALSHAAWLYARGGYEALRGSPPSAGGDDAAGQGPGQGGVGGGLPSAMRRALVMALAAVVVLVLFGAFFYRAGGEGGVGGAGLERRFY